MLTCFGGGAFFLGSAWTAFLALAPFCGMTCFVLAMMCKSVSEEREFSDLLDNQVKMPI